MDAQRVLVVAPTAPQAPPLTAVRYELNTIGKWHIITLISEVGKYDVLRVAAEGEMQDIYHFSGHLGEGGFEASGFTLPMESLIMIIKTGEPKLAVFNTCSSAALAERVVSQSATDCIYTTREVNDDRSAEFSIAFYAVLRRESVTSYLQACRIVDPQDDIFRYVNASRNARPESKPEVSVTPAASVNLALAERLQKEINDVKERVKAIEGFLSGNLGEPGLTAQVLNIKTDIRNIEREITVIEALDARLDRFESILERYDPMWRAMESSYTSKATIPVFVFYAFLILLALALGVAYVVSLKG